MVCMKKLFGLSKMVWAFLLSLFVMTGTAFAGEADLVVPNIAQDPKSYQLLIIGIAQDPKSYQLLIIGIVISVLGLIFGLIEYLKVKSIPVHKSMADIGNLIFETCKTYLIQQGKFLILLEGLQYVSVSTSADCSICPLKKY